MRGTVSCIDCVVVNVLWQEPNVDTEQPLYWDSGDTASGHCGSDYVNGGMLITDHSHWTRHWLWTGSTQLFAVSAMQNLDSQISPSPPSWSCMMIVFCPSFCTALSAGQLPREMYSRLMLLISGVCESCWESNGATMLGMMRSWDEQPSIHTFWLLPKHCISLLDLVLRGWRLSSRTSPWMKQLSWSLVYHPLWGPSGACEKWWRWYSVV